MSDSKKPMSSVVTERESSSSQRLQLVVLSASDVPSLDQATEKLTECLRQREELSFADIVYTLQCNYSALPVRRMLVCQHREDGYEALAEGNPRRVLTGTANETRRPVAFLFPGLGDHYAGMAEQLYQQEAVFREQVDRCAELLRPLLQRDLRDDLYPNRHRTTTEEPASRADAGPGSGGLDLRKMLRRQREPETVLQQTALAQPAVFVVEYALAQLFISWGIQPQALLGYSLGEYVAACLAGVFSLADALALVAQRARMIQELPAGLMLAVQLSAQEIAPLLGGELVLSAINGPDLCVVGGPVSAIEGLEAALRGREIGAYRLQTAHAFHTYMMEPMVEAFVRLVQTIPLHAPRIPYLSNVTGTWITASEATDPAYWARHLCQTVQLSENIQALWHETPYVLLEVGPGQTLSGQALRYSMEQQLSERVAIPALRAAYEQQNDEVVLLTALGRLWLAGVSIDWQQGISGEALRCVSLPIKQHLGERSAPSLSASEAEEAGATYTFTSSERKPRPALLTPYVEPETVTEKKIIAIWQDVLNIEEIGIYDNFFELGGHSLLAIRIVAFLGDIFQVEVPLQAMFSANTVIDLAQIIDSLQCADPTNEVFGEEDAALWTDLDELPGSGTAGLLNYELPDGTVIVHQNKAETDHFYEDIFEHEVYTQHGIVLNDEACIFDVGANIGLFTLYASRKSKGARIYAFEPAPQLFALLQENVSRFQIGARLFNYGLSNTTKTATFTFYPFSSGMSSFYADKEEERAVLATLLQNQVQQGRPEMEQVMAYSQELLNERLKSQELTCQLCPLSEVIAEHRIERIDLLKIDVQKSELDVLAGINDEDWAKIQQIVMEVHNLDKRIDHVANLLQHHGYEIVIEQDVLYKGSVMYNISARRKG